MIEQTILTITLSSLVLGILTLTLGLIFLIGGSLLDLSFATIDYYRQRPIHREYCLQGAETNPRIYWKDETFMGFGPEGSYGCFLSDPIEDIKPTNHTDTQKTKKGKPK